MKIKDIKINNFGKLENIEYEFKDGINLIYGENESGKTTLFKFIYSMFYGVSKNKNGKTIPDSEKYNPWNNGEFSGKLKYELDNGESYEIFREFEKKNPKIYNEASEDISKTFIIDKTKGNRFFYEQTNVDEDLFCETVLTAQREVELDEKRQSMLLQKMTNIVGTGEDNTSFNKTMNKLNKRLLEDVGTSRSTDRPINIAEKRINQIKQEKSEIKFYASSKYNIEEQNKNIVEEIKKSQYRLETLKQYKKASDLEKIEQEKIKVNKKVQEENNKEIAELERKLEDIKLEEVRISKEQENRLDKRKSKNTFKIALIVISIILEIISIAFLRNIAISIALGVILIIINSMSLMSEGKAKKKINVQFEEKLNENKQKQSEIKKQIELIEKNNLEYSNSTKEIEEKLDAIRKQSNIEELSNIDKLYENEQNTLNNLNLNLHKLELEKQNILPKLDNLAKLEEELESLEETYNELEEESKSINLAKEYLEIAYNQMKNSITPKFTKNLSENIERITNGKYKNVKFNDEKGIIVEAENGNYILAENLSTGTIEELYLSLRLGAIEEISKENLPVILDEAFAYFDKPRLENVLKYLNDISDKRQVFIFTCTQREKAILNELNINYNYIDMNRTIALEKNSNL